MILLMAFLLTGCASKKKIIRELDKDSVRVEYKYIEKIVKDTVAVAEIKSNEKEIVTRDTISRLENDYAVSVARVDTLGLLYHSLKTIPQKIYAEVETKYITKDSIVYRDRNHEMTITKTIKDKPTFWQKIKMNAFEVVLILLLLETAFVLFKRRK